MGRSRRRRPIRRCQPGIGAHEYPPAQPASRYRLEAGRAARLILAASAAAAAMCGVIALVVLAAAVGGQIPPAAGAAGARSSSPPSRPGLSLSRPGPAPGATLATYGDAGSGVPKTISVNVTGEWGISWTFACPAGRKNRFIVEDTTGTVQVHATSAQGRGVWWSPAVSGLRHLLIVSRCPWRAAIIRPAAGMPGRGAAAAPGRPRGRQRGQGGRSHGQAGQGGDGQGSHGQGGQGPAGRGPGGQSRASLVT